MTYDSAVLAKRLKTARNEMGYTLAYIAEACHIQQYQTISKWEKEKSEPSIHDLLRLCELYGCDLGYLVGEYDCKTRKAADIKAETGLSETVINRLRVDNVVNRPRIQALNAIIEFDEGEILQDICGFLFHKFDGQIEAGNVVIDGNNIADVFLLEIISRLHALRDRISKSKDIKP